jgi:hypothetical protein
VASFSTTAFRCLAGLAQYGFVPATAVAQPDFAALVCRRNEVVCYYLLARDDRSGGGPVRVDLWVAPPASPDDVVGRFGIGEKISIAEAASYDVTFFSEVHDRVVAQLPQLSALAHQVEHRYTTESAPNKALQVNQQGQALLKALHQYARSDAGRYVALIFHLAVDVANGQATFGRLEETCTEVAAQLLQDSQAPPEVCHLTFQGQAMQIGALSATEWQARLVGRVLAPQLYIEALVPDQS